MGYGLIKYMDWLIAGFFISIPILIYGGLIISDAKNYQNKKRYYFGVFIILFIICFSIWLVEKEYVSQFLSDIKPSHDEGYNPGEYYPY